MISAAGSPNFSSPFSRSSCDRRSKSCCSVSSPVIATSKPALPSATGPLLESVGLAVVEERTEISVACRSSETSPPEPSRYVRARPSAVISGSSTKSHEDLEAWRVDRVPGGAHDHDVRRGRRGIRRQGGEQRVLRALGLGVVRRGTLGREAPAEEQRDRGDREHEDRDPGAERATDGGRRLRRVTRSRASCGQLPRMAGGAVGTRPRERKTAHFAALPHESATGCNHRAENEGSVLSGLGSPKLLRR